MSHEPETAEVATEANEVLLGEYKAFMEEIFRRLDAISESIAELKSDISHVNNWKNCEFSWSQIRKICEYLTVAIVFAHHCDTGAISELDKWRPKDLLAQAAKLNEHPTPVPIEAAFDTGSDGEKQIKPQTRPVAPD